MGFRATHHQRNLSCMSLFCSVAFCRISHRIPQPSETNRARYEQRHKDRLLQSRNRVVYLVQLEEKLGYKYTTKTRKTKLTTRLSHPSSKRTSLMPKERAKTTNTQRAHLSCLRELHDFVAHANDARGCYYGTLTTTDEKLVNRSDLLEDAPFWNITDHLVKNPTTLRREPVQLDFFQRSQRLPCSAPE